MKILLIEPDKKLATTYTAYLESHGHTIHSATHAQAGILAADKTTPDLVILELQLVAHSGIEFLHEFRSYADWQNIPVIIHSHVPPQEFAASEAMLRRLGVRAYHYKPRTTLATLLLSVASLSQIPLAEGAE